MPTPEPTEALSLAGSQSAPEPEPLYVIRPGCGWAGIGLAPLWRYRDLVRFLTWRDIQLRYRQTALGVAWAVLQPAATMAVFSLVFGRLAGMPSDGRPYPLFVFCALLPWQLFAHALTDASNSLVANQNLVTKIYFPRLVVPLAAVLAGLVDFGVSFVVFLGLLAWYGVAPTGAALALPALLLLALVSAFGVGLWLSALNVRYRDVRHALPFLTQFWMFATPIAYPASLVPESWRPLLGLNPMAGVVEGFRWALLGSGTVPPVLWVSTAVALGLCYAGLRYFNHVERTFADVI